MRIVGVEAFPVLVPLASPIAMANQRIDRSANVLVKVETDEGIVGWGEGVAAPEVTGESQDRISADVEALAAVVVGEDPRRRTALWLRMRRVLPTRSTATGAIDMALHDIAAKASGLRVADLLGGAVRDRIPALTLVGGDPDRDVAEAERRFAAGYRWFKVKLAVRGAEAEREALERVSAMVGADGLVCGDANEGWGEEEAAAFLAGLEADRVAFVEQPIRRGDWEAFARLARSSPVPLCGDESVRSQADLVSARAAGLGGVSLKLIKLGGITGVMRAAATCEALGLQVNLAGKVAETSVAAAANVHCAAAMSDVGFGCSPGNQGTLADVTRDPLAVVEGVVPLPEGAGLGVDVDEDLVRALVPG